MKECKCNKVIYSSNVFKCTNCRKSKFTTGGKTCCDNEMHDGDEVQCVGCGKIGEVFCDDGSCLIYWWAKDG